MQATEWSEVLEQDGVKVYRMAYKPIDCFKIVKKLNGVNWDKMCESLVELDHRMVWDTDLTDGTKVIERYGKNAQLQRLVTKGMGPVSGRSWISLAKRFEQSAVRSSVIYCGIDNADELHDTRHTKALQGPQILRLDRKEDGRVILTQTVQFQLGGWLPMSAVLGQIPNLLVTSSNRWFEWVKQHCEENE
jgi:hypothetical protein